MQARSIHKGMAREKEAQWEEEEEEEVDEATKEWESGIERIV